MAPFLDESLIDQRRKRQALITFGALRLDVGAARVEVRLRARVRRAARAASTAYRSHTQRPSLRQRRRQSDA